MNPEGITPEFISAAPEQTEELLIACNALLEHRSSIVDDGFWRENEGYYVDTFSIHQPPGAIARGFLDLPHDSKVTSRNYALTVFLGYEDSKVVESAVEVIFRRSSMLSFGFPLRSTVRYEVDGADIPFRRTASCTDSLDLGGIQEGLRSTRGKDASLHKALQTLAAERTHEMSLRRDETKHDEYQAVVDHKKEREQQALALGLMTATYAEIAAVTQSIRALAR